ncbi:MAG: alpha/beta hydrolase [Candidatus Sumerlaeota bacterium]|nr:alpha/beta hydrolase [Candidatus Sumerlaeota bacterium]
MTPTVDILGASSATFSATATQVVFLLHGICKTRGDMFPLSMALKRRGYEVINWRYHSRKHRINELADQLSSAVASRPDARIHFITHSMGGIIVRTCLARHHFPNIGRFVMIGPPNQGARLADVLSRWALYRLVFGPAGLDLRQGENGVCRDAGIPNCEFGIIAGGRGGSRGKNPFLPGDNDGTVTVESTRLEGAADFLLVPYSHTIIHMMPRTIRAAIKFIETGRFNTNRSEECRPLSLPALSHIAISQLARTGAAWGGRKRLGARR